MNVRYQVFLSSTYVDLKIEREKVIQTILKLKCFPAGMEFFPASGDEQFEFIKKIIDDSDYYILVIAGKYGSMTSEGISYTEKEYDYAIEKGFKVMAFIHRNPEQLSKGKIETNPDTQDKLERFIKKVKSNKICVEWEDPNELASSVASSLHQAFTNDPAIGWVRAEYLQNGNGLLADKENTNTENINIRSQLDSKSEFSVLPLSPLADMDVKIKITLLLAPRIKYRDSFTDSSTYVTISWKELFSIISPHFMKAVNEFEYKKIILKTLCETIPIKYREYNISLYDIDFQRIKVQFSALQLIHFEVREIQFQEIPFWYLTDAGKQLMYDLITQKDY